MTIYSVVVNFEAYDYTAASELANQLGQELARVCDRPVRVSEPAEVIPIPFVVNEDDEC